MLETIRIDATVSSSSQSLCSVLVFITCFSKAMMKKHSSTSSTSYSIVREGWGSLVESCLLTALKNL